MKIAFTHNLKVSDAEEQAEFDSPETVEALAEALGSLGHDVHRVDVSGVASRLVARLEALQPDLVFNTAEGSHGRYREAFYPALFEQLRLPFTGSGAYVCAVTLDKQASKLLVAQHGVPTPRWYFYDGSSEWSPPDFRFPVIVKPNFEGSSKGISESSIVESAGELRRLVDEALPRYPAGLLCEEFIEGSDVTVPYLQTRGVLTPASYSFAEEAVAGRRWVIYDYALKNHSSDAVSVEVPAAVPDEVREKVREYARRVVVALGLDDVARVDFRVTADGEIYFIEVNALPSLEPGASLYESARDVGLTTVTEVLDEILRSAIQRQDIAPRERASKIRVGLAYNLKRIDPRRDDAEAEYDSPTTVAAIRAALESMGHDVVDLEATPELLTVLPAADVDVVFNIAEGLHGRNREAQVPAILELLDIPYTGSDPATLAITLDKGLAKRLVREAGHATPRARLLADAAGIDDLGFDYPVIAKPNAEGSSKGVTSTSVCRTPAELAKAVEQMTASYRQAILVEEYLPGREFTVAVLGELEPRALPPMEIVFAEEAGELPVYTFGHKIETEGGVSYEVPANIDSDLGQRIAELAVGVFQTLGCRDVARIDVRLDARGEPSFIECNPLPGLTPGWSDLCQIATASGLTYESLIGEILAPALRRLQAARAK